MLIFDQDIYNNTNIHYYDIYAELCKMGKNINNNYIYEALLDKKNKLILYSIHSDKDNFDLANCPCGLIYKVHKVNQEIYIYISFIATGYKCRNMGYASLFMKEFISYIKKKYVYHKVSIILDSLMNSVTFYEHIGFTWVYDASKYYKYLNISLDDDTEHFIMVYCV
jgi:ribosomal protein S18 acetylase RimI-like enzyme